MKWYYADNGRQVGPVNDDEFRLLIDKGTVQMDTLVWNETMTDWKRYREFSGGDLTQKVTGAPYKNCSECGNTFSHADMINYENTWVCAACKPVFVQKLKEGMQVGHTMVYAGFWIRFAAQIIDGIILGIANLVVSIPLYILIGIMGISSAKSDVGPDMENMFVFFALQIIIYILQVSIAVGYETWMIGKYSATLGKMACKIKVVMSDGGRVTYLRAFGRYFAKIISWLILGIGYLMVAFDNEKRGLHDHICDTRVIKA